MRFPETARRRLCWTLAVVLCSGLLNAIPGLSGEAIAAYRPAAAQRDQPVPSHGTIPFTDAGALAIARHTAPRARAATLPGAGAPSPMTVALTSGSSANKATVNVLDTAQPVFR